MEKSFLTAFFLDILNQHYSIILITAKTDIFGSMIVVYKLIKHIFPITLMKWDQYKDFQKN